MSWWPSRRREADDVRTPGPASYAEWSGWFDAFAKGGEDEPLFQHAGNGSLSWTAGTAERLAERSAGALTARLDMTCVSLQTALRRGSTPLDLERAVLDARRSLALLGRYADLPCWPEVLARQLRSMIEDTARELQKNLLKDAAGDRSGRLASTLRRTPLDQLDRVTVGAAPATSQPTERAGRRILL